MDMACSSQSLSFNDAQSSAGIAHDLTVGMNFIIFEKRKNPRVSLQALIAAYSSASAELRLTKACVRLHILIGCDPHNMHPPEVDRRVLLHPAQSLSVKQVTSPIVP